jgi:hypothetical protein
VAGTPIQHHQCLQSETWRPSDTSRSPGQHGVVPATGPGTRSHGCCTAQGRHSTQLLLESSSPPGPKRDVRELTTMLRFKSCCCSGLESATEDINSIKVVEDPTGYPPAGCPKSPRVSSCLLIAGRPLLAGAIQYFITVPDFSPPSPADTGGRPQSLR